MIQREYLMLRLTASSLLLGVVTGVTVARHDGSRVPRNENLAFGLDTFFDHRNGYDFEQTPVGGMLDAQISNDGVTIDSNWNAVLEHGAARFAEGWAVEMRIPFKTLR